MSKPGRPIVGVLSLLCPTISFLSLAPALPPGSPFRAAVNGAGIAYIGQRLKPTSALSRHASPRSKITRVISLLHPITEKSCSRKPGFRHRRGYSEFSDSFSLRTTITGQWAWWMTLSDTLPMRARLTPPRPRLPITIRPAPISSLRPTISWSFRPLLRWASCTLPPASSIFLTP